MTRGCSCVRLDDGFFAIAIEDMHLGHINDQRNVVVDGCARAWVESGDHFFAAVLDEGIDFAAEWLTDSHAGAESGVFFDATRDEALVVDVLGADAEVD